MGKCCFGRLFCNSCNRFRAKLNINDDQPLQQLPKPKEADQLDAAPSANETTPKEDILIIRQINPCIEINGVLHRTSKYETMRRAIDPNLVVRRGQPFVLEMLLSRPYDPKRDGISFIFRVDDDDKPSYGHGTLVAVPLLPKPDKSFDWNVTVDSIIDTQLRVQVAPAPDCIVAKWKMDVDTKIIEDGAYSYSWSVDIYIIFNPWCVHDQVHLDAEDWREEAVLHDVGLIWRGTSNRLRPCIWKYSQFERSILDCSLYVIKTVGKLTRLDRADPVKIARSLAAAVNSVDDEGVVMGNWTENFDGGTPPTKWLGSAEILQKYYKKRKPVKYGQCWVFSGVLTTICRALGIPARTVTNYSSAHDTQSSLTVDYFLDDKGTVLEELNSDSIWNFHVWNEVWMARPDLGAKYGGWQAVDATPQEQSDNMYRCGPTSVYAVKHGEVKRPYDCSFLFAEVNADKVYWKYEGPSQPLKLLGKDIYGIGKSISTKTPGRFDRLDVTDSYKYEEKTDEERATMLRALRQSQNLFSRYYLNEDFNDVRFNFELLDDIKIGQPFDVRLFVSNRSRIKDYVVYVTLKVDVVTYTGKVGDTVKRSDHEISVTARNDHDVKLTVTYDEYYKRLIDQCAFNVSCLARIGGTRYEYYAQDDFRVRKPDVKIQLQGIAKSGKEITADVHLENPLPIALRKCEFVVDAPGLPKQQLKLKVKNAVGPGQRAVAQFKFTPPTPGRNNVAAKFTSKELDDCDGFLNFMVEATKEEACDN